MVSITINGSYCPEPRQAYRSTKMAELGHRVVWMATDVSVEGKRIKNPSRAAQAQEGFH